MRRESGPCLCFFASRRLNSEGHAKRFDSTPEGGDSSGTALLTPAILS